jgi:hypothetical protein
LFNEGNGEIFRQEKKLSGERVIFPKKTIENKLLLISASLLFGLLLLNSINSGDYYNTDEYFQIIEFAAFKQGKVRAVDLAWEYQKKSRQAIQPFLCYLLFETLDRINITKPFHQIRALRILTGFFTVFCVIVFVVSALRFFTPRYRPAFILFSFLFWAVPYFYVRFTSEAFSQSLFLLAFSILFSGKNNLWRTFFLGMVLGLTFFVRFQSAFGLLGLFIGLVIFHRFRFTDFVYCAVGSAVTIIGCIGIDAWFYGTWILSPWNYFNQQILLNVANDFGVSPFTYYFKKLFVFSTPVYGLVFYAMLAGLIYARKINTVYLVFISTLLILSFIGHKEFRFLISILNFLPFLTISGIQEIHAKKPAFAQWMENKFFLAIAISINVFMLCIGTANNNNWLSLNPRSLGCAIVRDYSDARISLMYVADCHPFMIDVIVKSLNDTLILYQRYFMPGQFTDCRITSLEDSCLTNRPENTTQILYVNKARFLSLAGRHKFDTLSYHLKYISLPRWMDDLLNKNIFLGKHLDKYVFYAFVR